MKYLIEYRTEYVVGYLIEYRVEYIVDYRICKLKGLDKSRQTLAIYFVAGCPHPDLDGGSCATSLSSRTRTITSGDVLGVTGLISW